MRTLREADVQPLDLLLFRGVDPVSKAIQFLERREVGLGDYSHAGVAITREVLDLPCLEPGKVYVWESTMSASEGFWANFADRVPAAETKGVRFGVQLRDLELVIPGYMSDGGRVYWSAYHGERPPPEKLREQLKELHTEYGHAPYARNLLKVAGTIFPELRSAGDRLDRAENSVAKVVNDLLERSRRSKRLEDADHHVFCSEWVAVVYQRLGLLDVPDPRLVAPVHFITRTHLFSRPERLVPEGIDRRSLIDRPRPIVSGRSKKGLAAYARSSQAAFLRHHVLRERLRAYAAGCAAEVRISDDDRVSIGFREETARAAGQAEQWLAEDMSLDLRRTRAPLALGAEPPPLSIAVLAPGNREHVEPFVAIGRKLVQDGHRVRIAAHAPLRGLVESNGLEFYPLGGHPSEPIAYLPRPGAGLLSTRRAARSEQGRMLDELIQSTWGACTKKDPDRAEAERFVADAIVSSPLAHSHIHVAEALSVPLQIVSTLPWAPTREFPHALANLDFERGPCLENWLSYAMVDSLVWAGVADSIARFRKARGLAKLGRGKDPGLLAEAGVPVCHLFPSGLVPFPDDWGEDVDVAAFVLPDPGDEYVPPGDLSAFLDAGDPPIYVGFGSRAIGDPESVTRTVVDALEAAGKRGVLAAGLSRPPGGSSPPEHVHWVDDCPPGWLFPRCAAVCHHGGAELTAAGLWAARPTVVVPFFGEHSFWGAMVARSGAGPRPVPARDLDAGRLAAAFRACSAPEMATRADEIATRLRGQDGAALAVQSFYRHLPTTLDGVLATLGFDARDRQRMRAGEIVTGATEKVLGRAVGFVLAAGIDRPCEEVFSALVSGRAVELDPRNLGFGALGDREAEPADFAGVGYGPEEAGEFAELLRASPAGPFNLSGPEIDGFAALGRRFPEATPGQEAIEAVNQALRQLLYERYRAYRKTGLAGIADYARPRQGRTNVSELLRIALEPSSLLSEDFPDFFRALLEYPESNEGIESRFYWIKQQLAGHPVFSLTHHFYLAGDPVCVAAVRSYYIGRGLDALQILVGLMPHGSSTLLVCSQRMGGVELAGITRRAQRREIRERSTEAAIQIVEALRSDVTREG